MGRDAVKVYRVAEITRRVRQALESTFGDLWIEGEISNLRRPASGHCYFTLKDADAQISAVMFRGDQRSLRAPLRDGVLVKAFGRLTVYERGGVYQVVVRRLEQSGEGALQAAFEKLKAALQKEGLFDADRKQPLPRLPRCVGLVTSGTGAALRDILHVLRRRFPNLRLLLVPVRVQGEGAAAEIAEGIDRLNAHGEAEVMIIGRGGGSLEDLWCFNEEIVARAVARSRIPVISAVGHEIDFTISDFAADVRAPTPSAAAEIVVDRREAFEQEIATYASRLARALRERQLEGRNRLTAAASSYLLRDPGRIVEHRRQHLADLVARLRHETTVRMAGGRQRTDELGMRLGQAARDALRTGREDTRRLASQLRALSPQAVLERGFSITHRPDGGVVRTVNDVTAGETITTRLAGGTVESEVTATHERKEEDGTTPQL